MGVILNHETKSLINLVSNLAFSLAIPIYILNSKTLPLSPEMKLVIAIAFPLFYGAFEWWQTKKHNMLSLFGLINVIVTGGFGLLMLEGSWFSIKEASFPLLVGLFVLVSGMKKKPLFGKMMMAPEVFDINKLDEKLKLTNSQSEFDKLILNSNHFLSLSFFISAILNYVIARKTFLPINEALSAEQKANILNEQIALMHQRGFIGIALPSMIMLLGLLFYYFKQVEKITGASIDTFFHSPVKKD